jgi:HTH-type transcriptional regulator, cell division transcriptional repressor
MVSTCVSRRPVGPLATKGIQITQTGISKLENQQRYVMDYEVLAIAKALRVSVSWLYGQAKMP